MSLISCFGRLLNLNNSAHFKCIYSFQNRCLQMFSIKIVQRSRPDFYYVVLVLIVQNKHI